VVLADDMGLGKTIQAIAAAELLRRRRGIERLLVIAPASVKYQWKTEAVVNFEPPWNPARLEQRIGRVHRLGQAQPVQVIHLLTEDRIEERVWETLRLKRALFSGLFDSTTDEVSFEKLGRKSMMQVVKEVFCEQAGRPMPVLAPPAQAPRGVEEAERKRLGEPLPPRHSSPTRRAGSAIWSCPVAG
jgi:hypothetical protein